MKAQAITEGYGYHNMMLQQSAQRIKKGGGYRDLSTVCIMPCLGHVHMRVIMSWFNMMTPMNQKFWRMPVVGMEIGAAYNIAVETILNHPEARNWKYMLTLEADNMPPPDGLLKLYESIEDYDVVGGLYFTKGYGGQPMIYGDPAIMPLNFWPQTPQDGIVQRCNGLGMGFTLFKIDIFKDPRLENQWFKTQQELVAGGARAYTQDLYFFERAGAMGYKFACDTRVKVGHYDEAQDMVW